MIEQLEQLLYSNNPVDVKLAITLLNSQKINLPFDLVELCNLLNVPHWNDDALYEFLTQDSLCIFHLPITKLPSVVAKTNFIDYNFFGCKLYSLENMPREVRGFVSANNNELVTLKGSPKIVRNGYFVDDNYLTSLEFAPEIVYDRFWCGDNLVKFTTADVLKYTKIISDHSNPIRCDGVSLKNR